MLKLLSTISFQPSVAVSAVNWAGAGLAGIRHLHQQQLPLERLQAAITPSVCHELATKGFAVVDNVFGNIVTHQLKLEVERLYSSGMMHLNHTHLVQQGSTQLLAKSNIHEAELTFDPAVQAAAPLVAQLNADKSLATLLSLFIPQLRLESAAIKLQYNEGNGGCFPMHFDSDLRLDGRRVTAIFYLNDSWTPDAQGQLRLYPFPAPPVDIAPVKDRLVLFSTAHMLHRVLPSAVPRCCFTIWLSESVKPLGTSSAATMPTPPPSTGAEDAQTWRFLMHPTVRQHVCKLAYAEEWAQSILESHPACAETNAALEKHKSEIEVINRALAKYQPTLQRLLSAAEIAATATAAAAICDDISASGSARDSEGRSAAAAEPHLVAPPVVGSGSCSLSEQQLQQAYALLRDVAAHVKWF